MALVPVPQAGRLLRWNSTATALENATISDLLDEIAGAVAPDPAVRRYWLATPGVSVVAGGISLALTPGAPTVVAVAPVSRAFTLTGIAIALTPTAPGVQVQAAGNFATTLTGIALPLMVSAPAVAKSSAATLTGLSLALTPGNPGVSTAANVSVSAQTVNLSVTPTAPGVSTGSSAVALTDDFNRADGALGTGWTGVGTGALRVVSNRLAAPSNSTEGASLRDETPAANQYAEIEVVTLPFQVNAGIGVRVRGQAGTNNGYTAVMGYADDEGFPLARLDIRLNGTPIIEDFPADFSGWNVLRLEVVGNALTVKTATTHGGTYTTRLSTTNGTYATGRVGAYANAPGVRGDNFYGGDL